MTAQVSLKNTCIPLYRVVAIASHIVSAFGRYLKLTKAKANLKFIYVAKLKKFSPFWKETLSLT